VIADNINKNLAAEDDRLTQGFTGPKMPVTFLFSQARAGSTLLMQLMISSMNVGYVSNLLARFWKAPYLGALLDISLRDHNYVSSFTSSFGNVQGAQEPHEWGWFWRHWLKLEKEQAFCHDNADIDRQGLKSKIAALEEVFGAPLVFDNVFAMNNFSLIRDILGQVLVIHMERDPYFLCNSLINARINRHGDIYTHYGNAPQNTEEIETLQDPVERIVAQVSATTREMDQHLINMPSERVFRVAYEELINTPWEIMSKLAEFLNDHDAKVDMRNNLADIEFKSRNTLQVINPDYKEALDRHFKAYF